MTDTALRQALAYARRGWPVFPCLPGQKIPATTHGFRDATTDEQQCSPSLRMSHEGLSSLRCNFFLCCYLRPALRRPSKVMSKAFRAAFHRLVQRWRPRPVGSRLMIARYRHFRAACSVGK